MNKKTFFFTLGICLVLALITYCSKNVTPLTQVNSDQHAILKTLQKVDDYPVYMMEYEGDYRFSDYLQDGEYPQLSNLEPLNRTRGDWACTCFSALGDEGTRIFSRNFDWHDCIPLVLYTRAPNAYASVSLVDLEYLGFHRANLPDETLENRRLLYTPYLPFDGMNEKGVAVGMMAVQMARGTYDPLKVTIGEIEVIRLILDYAANVEEALQLIQLYNIQFTQPPIHYMISDRTGNSVIIEFLEGKMYTFTSQDSFHIASNFLIQGSNAPIHTPCWRYNSVFNALKEKKGVLTEREGLSILSQVSQSNTIWSTVYNMKSGEILLAPARKYSSPLQIQLPLVK